MRNNSTFQLYMQSDLSTSDFKVLALLYQPLLGIESYSLYTTFYEMLHQANVLNLTHQTLFDLLNIKQTDFLKMRTKLEALNLVESYQSEDKYIYILKAPLSAKQFLTDTVFGSYLQSEIGDKNLSILVQMFKKELPNLENFKNISKPFDALYEFKQLNLLKVEHELEGRIASQGLTIHSNFDYHGFVELLPERLKTSQLLSQKLQETIEKIAFVYNFNINDMKEIYEEASRSRQNLNFQVLNFKAKQYFEKQNQVLSIKEKQTPEIELIEKAKPQEIVQKFAKVDQQGIALSTVLQLLERNQVEVGIVNVLLMFVLKNKDGILPTINYLEKVLNDWLNKGIRTTEDAISHTEKLETTYTSQKTQTKTVNKSAEPDWMDDYVKRIAEMEE